MHWTSNAITMRAKLISLVFLSRIPRALRGEDRHRSRGFLGGAKPPKPGVSKGDVFPFGQGRGLMPRPRGAKVEPRRRRWLDVASLASTRWSGQTSAAVAQIAYETLLPFR